jgi:mannitol/fructose-specific phosphotransferase system IIA component (Ntr-type)
MILAGLFEEAGLAMIIGAYVMGLSLSRSDINHVVREKVEAIATFLVPIFFTVMGMMVDVQALMSRDVLVFGVLFSVVAVASKLVGCGAPALLCNFNLRGAMRIGVGMLPRGEVTLIVAGVGMSAGYLDGRTFGVVVCMTLLASLLAPPLIVGLFRSSESGLKHVPETGKGAALAFDFPSPEIAELLVRKLFEVFASEGFFVHTLNRQQRLYQLRRDEIVINFSQTGKQIGFDCAERDVPLVNAAMLEVVAVLEDLVRELRKPVDHGEIVRKLQADTLRSPSRMAGLASFVKRELLVPSLQGNTKEAVIDELLSKLAEQGKVRDVDVARDAVLKRERSMSTGMQYGIAIPHGRTDSVSELVCAVGLKPEGVDFDSIDGEPTRIVVLTLSPQNAAAPHVQFMSAVSQFLNAEGRVSLLECRSTDEMYKLLTESSAVERRKITSVPIKRLTGQGGMQPGLAKYLRPECIDTDLPGSTKEEVIDALLDILVRNNVVKNLSTVRMTILERERQMSTGMEHGIAIPHARTDEVSELVCAVGLKKDGLDFDAIDGQPSQIFVLTLSPRAATDPHIQFMAMISRVLDDAGRARVLAAENAQQVYEALTRGDVG